MPRDGSGNMTLPSGNPVVSGTAASSTDFNNTMSDFAAEMTDSLSRSGKGGMSNPFKVVDGSVRAPGLSFASDTDNGLYRLGANNFALALGGAMIGNFAATVIQWISQVTDGPSARGHIFDVANALSNARAKLVTFTNAATEQLAVMFDGTLQAGPGLSAGLRGSAADGASAVGVILDNGVGLATLGAKALSVRVNGAEEASFDKDGNLRCTASTPSFSTSGVTYPTGVGGGTGTAPSGTVAYWKDPFGFVHLKGYVTATNGFGNLLLPSGYRPHSGLDGTKYPAPSLKPGDGLSSVTGGVVGLASGTSASVFGPADNGLVGTTYWYADNIAFYAA